MRLLLGLVAVTLCTAPAHAADIDALYAALEASDTQAVERFVTDHYRDAGISVNETLEWQHQPFDQIVNWYNQHTEVIMLSELPQPAEVAPYWDNWSAVLTEGRWDWRSFFADATEAALLANFNQFLLAAHEYGHALTYRYDPEHEARYDYAINCREYLADRLAAALLEEVADADARLASLRQRYRALIDVINGQIAPQYRYEVPTFAALDADCRLLAVEQPTETSMTPYASAFFVRHALLQAADLPPLAELYATHLLPFWRERQPPASGRAGPVTTGAAVAVQSATASAILPFEQRQLAFAPDGTLYAIDAGADPDAEPPRIRFSYGKADAPLELAIPPSDLPGVVLGDFRLLSFSGAVSLGPDRFLVISGGAGLGSMPILLFDVARRDGRWQLRVVDLEPDCAVAESIALVGLARDPAGQPSAFLIEPGSGTTPARWRRIDLDSTTLAPLATHHLPFSGADTPAALGPAGETYFFDDHRILVVNRDGRAEAFAGAGLQGFKDAADPLRAEFAVLTAPLHQRPDGGMDMLDYDPAAGTYVLRHIAPAQ